MTLPSQAMGSDCTLVRQAKQIIGADIEEFSDLDQARDGRVGVPIFIFLIPAWFQTEDFSHCVLCVSVFFSEQFESFRKN